jgi:glycosyltransferase involved in cell wall biosynthesis
MSAVTPEPCLSVVMPCFNERETIETVVGRVLASPYTEEVVIVDDGSTDGTRDVLQSRSGVTVIFHERNAGKGAAIRTGLAYVTGEVAIVQDADLEYSPEDYPSLLAPILDGHADVVYGSRFLGGPHRVLFFWHSVANALLTLLSNMLSDLNLTDMETGFKVFRTSVLKSIDLQSDRFGFEPEITAKIARQGARIYEVPISYHGRDYAAGKKITWRDGLAALHHIVRFNLFSRQRTKRPVPHRVVRRPDTVAPAPALDHA